MNVKLILCVFFGSVEVDVILCFVVSSLPPRFVCWMFSAAIWEIKPQLTTSLWWWRSSSSSSLPQSPWPPRPPPPLTWRRTFCGRSSSWRWQTKSKHLAGIIASHLWKTRVFTALGLRALVLSCLKFQNGTDILIVTACESLPPKRGGRSQERYFQVKF